MKKFYLLTTLFSLTILGGLNLIAQEMIVGGNMENAGAWLTSKLNQNDGNTVEYTFNYTTDKPAAGIGGCLYVSGTNAGSAGNELTNFMFYQQVTLTRGVTYTFDGAYKDVRTNSYWTEVYVGGNEPVVGSDYGTSQGAVLVSGFKSMNWEANCPSDAFDGTFQVDACTPGSTNSVLFEGTGDTTVFFGFRMGIWDDQSNGYTFEVFIDNISLKGPEGGSAISAVTNNISLKPNPVENNLTITLDNVIQKINIVNVLGQVVYSAENIGLNSATVDFSAPQAGVYYIVVTDINGNTGTAKTLKL